MRAPERRKSEEMKRLVLLSALVILVLVTEINNAEASTAEAVMEKAGGLAAKAGRRVKRLAQAFYNGVRGKQNQSNHHSTDGASGEFNTGS
ncbi:uncharacterized protein LOC142564553 isoform X9 [Dermacentor variabilis]|uniref:uncharacterized protein LOC142564553 isoform X9 n=1 Tax=Dermacentor variabilis TaxID=34621 RepID=UPI003F5B9DF8